MTRCYWGQVRRSYVLLASFQQERLVRMGIGHFLSIPDFPLRLMFLEAVAEWWSFRTSSIVTWAGEFVLSLEDMARLTGLRVTGRLVTRRVHLGYSALAQELVGRQLAMSGEQLVVITSAVRRVSELAETVAGSGVKADQQLRAFLLVLFGEVLFSHASSKLSAWFLPLLADLERVGEYTWGAASLAHLYSTLFYFTDGSSHQLGRNLPFLQV